MNEGQLREALDGMALMDGVIGCALVDGETGMSWHASGAGPRLQEMVESASDFWRLYQRSCITFRDMGELRAQVLMHSLGRVTVVPCGQGTLLVVLSHEKDRVDWPQWHVRRAKLLELVSGF